jgi:hypothetical protein
LGDQLGCHHGVVGHFSVGDSTKKQESQEGLTAAFIDEHFGQNTPVGLAEGHAYKIMR